MGRSFWQWASFKPHTDRGWTRGVFYHQQWIDCCLSIDNLLCTQEVHNFYPLDNMLNRKMGAELCMPSNWRTSLCMLFTTNSIQTTRTFILVSHWFNLKLSFDISTYGRCYLSIPSIKWHTWKLRYSTADILVSLPYESRLESRKNPSTVHKTLPSFISPKLLKIWVPFWKKGVWGYTFILNHWNWKIVAYVYGMNKS